MALNAVQSNLTTVGTPGWEEPLSPLDNLDPHGRRRLSHDQEELDALRSMLEELLGNQAALPGQERPRPPVPKVKVTDKDPHSDPVKTDFNKPSTNCPQPSPGRSRLRPRGQAPAPVPAALVSAPVKTCSPPPPPPPPPPPFSATIHLQRPPVVATVSLSEDERPKEAIAEPVRKKINQPDMLDEDDGLEATSELDEEAEELRQKRISEARSKAERVLGIGDPDLLHQQEQIFRKARMATAVNEEQQDSKQKIMKDESGKKFKNHLRTFSFKLKKKVGKKDDELPSPPFCGGFGQNLNTSPIQMEVMFNGLRKDEDYFNKLAKDPLSECRTDAFALEAIHSRGFKDTDLEKLLKTDNVTDDYKPSTGQLLSSGINLANLKQTSAEYPWMLDQAELIPDSGRTSMDSLRNFDIPGEELLFRRASISSKMSGGGWSNEPTPPSRPRRLRPVSGTNMILSKHGDRRMDDPAIEEEDSEGEGNLQRQEESCGEQGRVSFEKGQRVVLQRRVVQKAVTSPLDSSHKRELAKKFASLAVADLLAPEPTALETHVYRDSIIDLYHDLSGPNSDSEEEEDEEEDSDQERERLARFNILRKYSDPTISPNMKSRSFNRSRATTGPPLGLAPLNTVPTAVSGNNSSINLLVSGMNREFSSRQGQQQWEYKAESEDTPFDEARVIASKRKLDDIMKQLVSA